MGKHRIIEAMKEALAHARGEKPLRKTVAGGQKATPQSLDAAKLKSIRRSLALTQAQMSELLGYEPHNYRQIERGASPVTLRLEKQVAAILALSGASNPAGRAA